MNTSTARIARQLTTIVLVAVAAWIAAACGSGEDDSGGAPAPGKAACTPVGEACGPRGGACCQGDDGLVQCLDGTCAVCLPLQAACTGVQCCDGAPCRGGTCCSIGGCAMDADCCGGRVCGGQRGCCIPAGSATSYNPDCCSGRAREIYRTNSSGGQDYVGSECI